MNEDLQMIQANLRSLRRLANWSLQDLAERIGVTAQTISNIENNKTVLTKIQYIAIRTVFDSELRYCIKNKKNITFVFASYILLYGDIKREKREFNDLETKLSLVASASAGGSSNNELEDACYLLFEKQLMDILVVAYMLLGMRKECDCKGCTDSKCRDIDKFFIGQIEEGKQRMSVKYLKGKEIAISELFFWGISKVIMEKELWERNRDGEKAE